jgi:hypothetical protein
MRVSSLHRIYESYVYANPYFSLRLTRNSFGIIIAYHNWRKNMSKLQGWSNGWVFFKNPPTHGFFGWVLMGFIGFFWAVSKRLK